jgi:hypothetical protein
MFCGILTVEIAMVVAGIIALIRGEIPVSKSHFVDGWPARVAGAILLLPLPMAFGIGFVYGMVRGANGDPIQPNELPYLTLYIDLPTLAICGFLAAGVTLGSAAADFWKGKTYLSDVEGGLGKWNDPSAGLPGIPSTAIAAGASSTPSSRPRRKKKRARSRASSTTGSRLPIILGVTGVFFLTSLLISGGTILIVNRRSDKSSTEKQPDTAPAVAKNNPPIKVPIPDRNPKATTPAPRQDTRVAANPKAPPPGEQKQGTAKQPPPPQRPPFGDAAAQTITLKDGAFQIQTQFGDADPFDRNSKQPAKLFLVKLEANQAYFAEMKQEGVGAVLPVVRLEESAGLEVAADRNPRSAAVSRLLYLVARTGVYRLIASTVGPGTGTFTLSLRQVQEGDSLPEMPPPLPVPAQGIQIARTIEPYLAATISPDAQSAWVAYPSGKVERFLCPSFTVLETYQLPKISQLALDRRGLLYAVVQKDKDADLNLYNTRALPAPGKTHTPVKVLHLHGVVQQLLLSPDDAWLYYLDTHNHKVGKIDLKLQKLERETNQIDPATNDLCQPPNGKSLYTCASSNVVQQLDPATLKIQKTLRIDRGAPNGIQATNSGYVFLNSGDAQATKVVLLNANRTDEKVAVVSPWASAYRSRTIRLSPDEKCLYTACFNQTPAVMTSFYLGERPALFPGQVFGSIILDARNAPGRMEVSKDSRFLFFDCGAILRVGP